MTKVAAKKLSLHILLVVLNENLMQLFMNQ